MQPAVPKLVSAPLYLSPPPFRVACSSGLSDSSFPKRSKIKQKVFFFYKKRKFYSFLQDTQDKKFTGQIQIKKNVKYFKLHKYAQLHTLN